MLNKLVAVFACLGFVAQAGAEVNFDQGIDVKSVIEQAKNSDLKAPYPYYGPQRVRYSRECKNFTYSGGFAQASERVLLQSTEFIEECRFVPNPPPPPPLPPNPGQPGNPGGHPGQPHQKDFNPGQPGFPGDHPVGHPGGYPNNHEDGPNSYTYPGSQHGQQGTYYCHERPGRSFRSTAQVNLPERQMFPWESETFEVCQEADRQDFETRNSPYHYTVGREGFLDVTYKLTPQYRTPTAPDSNGLGLVSWSVRDGKFVLSVSERWAQYYAGEKVAIKVELIKDGFLFFNTSLGEKEFTFDTANGYELVFVEGDMVKTKDFVDTGSDMRGPKKFSVKWGFRRIGSVSNGDYIKKGDTDKITK